MTPCHRCGRPGVRDIGTRGYCADHLAELVGTFHPTVPGVGLQTGLARPELGAGIVDLTCCRCQAGWSGLVGQTCWYCQQRTQKQEEHQIDLLLTPPDSGNLAGWAARLAVAVRQGLITEEVAARAVRRADAA